MKVVRVGVVQEGFVRIGVAQEGIVRVESCFPFTTNTVRWSVLDLKMCYGGNYRVIIVRGASIRLV